MPRVPLPFKGVTLSRNDSWSFSVGITQRSLLLRTHAPNLLSPLASALTPCACGLCRLLQAPADNRSFPALSPTIFLKMSDPLPRCLLECTFSFLLPELRPSPSGHRDRLSTTARIATSIRRPFSELQIFSYVQTSLFARHPSCSYYMLSHKHLMTFTSRQYTVRYLTVSRIY